MVSKLEELNSSFDGDRARGRCFAHILNLIVKSILQQFESTKKRNSTHGNENEADNTQGNDKTSGAQGNNEAGDGQGSDEAGDVQGNDEVPAIIDGDPDDVIDWRDERTAMSKEQLEGLDKSIQPLQGMLGKVRERSLTWQGVIYSR